MSAADTLDMLSQLHDTSDAYLSAIVVNSTDRAVELQDSARALGFEATAALLAALGMLDRALRMRAGQQPENDLQRLVWAAVDLTLHKAGAADELLPHLRRFM